MAKTATIATLVANLEMNSASFRKEMDQARARTKNFTKDMRNTKAANDGFTRSLRGAAQGVVAIDGPLGGVAGRLSAVNGLVTGGSLAWAGLGVAIAGVTAVMYKSVRAGEEMERQQLKIEALLKATDSASGRTAAQLDLQARSVARNTLASVAGVRDAQAVLLTFKSIQGETFDRAISLSQDLAAVMGGDAKSAALQLGKALEEPSTGLTALRRAGVSFTEAEKEQIKAMEDAGRVADAQRMILAKLAQQVGGAGTAEAGGLSGQVDTLSQNWQEFLEALSKTDEASKGVGLLAKFVENLRRGVAPTDLEQQELQYKKLHAQYVFHQQQLAKAEADGVQIQIQIQGKKVEEYRAKLQEMQSARIDSQKKEYADVVAAEEAAAAAREQAQRERAAAELSRQQEAGAAQLVQLDQFLADKQGKLQLEHEERLLQIANLQLSEQELQRRGYESIELLKEEYRLREQERYELQLEEQQRRIEDRHQRQLDAERRLQDQLTSEQERQARERARIEAIAAQERERMVGNMWTNLESLTSSKSRKLFEIGKAAAIANAVISTYESANKAMTTLPWPLNLAAAAATTAAGLVRVQAIRSQQFKGGAQSAAAGVSSDVSVGAGSNSTAPREPAIGPTEEREYQQPGTVVNLTIAGDLVGDNAQTIAQQITTLIAEQDLVIIPSGSRQAQELSG
ncbi:phage tail length tape measure family protein [Microbulbifer sp. HZ11]|uniref:phage tail length tape measure family protein n=1 Tax=Microbulbifer sp. HZ11 TaxID=1453501 RepID=UPI0005BD12A9|nr:phage tail length tape measure family protein [Microbulbifer sp. HZ11]